jgi:hypothetical protein
MATIDHLFDSAKGKLGNLVFYKVGGSGRVRTKAAHFRDRKSPGQMTQRQRLQTATGFLRPFRDLIRITFAAEAVGRSAMQAAQSHLMRNAMAGEYPDVYVDKSRVQLSRGPLAVPLSAKVTSQTEGLLIEWENGNEAAGQNASDTLVVMALYAETGYADYLFSGVRRSEDQYMWKLALQTGNEALPDVWIAFRNREETQLSNSMYVKQYT